MVSSTPRPHFTPGIDPVPILQEAGWAPGPVWTGGKSRPHRDSIPDRPAPYLVAIPTELPGPTNCTLLLPFADLLNFLVMSDKFINYKHVHPTYSRVKKGQLNWSPVA